MLYKPEHDPLSEDFDGQLVPDIDVSLPGQGRTFGNGYVTPVISVSMEQLLLRLKILPDLHLETLL